MLPVPLLAAVTLSLADATSAEYRAVPETRSRSLDFYTLPSVTLQVAKRRSAFTFGYGPRLGLVDVQNDSEFIVQQTGSAGYTLRTPRLQLSINLTGSYGQVSYYNAALLALPNMALPPPGSMAPAAGGTGNDGGTTGNGGGTVNPGNGGNVGGGTDSTGANGPVTQTPAATPLYLPPVAILDTMYAGISAGAIYLLTHRWTGAAGVGFSVGGGLRDSDRYLPLRYGPNAGVSATYQPTKSDGFTTAASITYDVLPNRDSNYQTLNLLETWTHSFDVRTVTSLAAGVTYLRAKVSDDAPHSHSLNGAGAATIARIFDLDGGSELTVGAGANLSTYYNPVFGTVYQSLGGNANIGWSRKRLALYAGAQASHSVPFDDPGAIGSYGASGGANYQVAAPLALRLGGYWTHQIFPDGTLANIDAERWGVILSVLVFAPPVRL